MLNYNATEKLGSITLNCNHFKQKSFTMSRLPGKRLSRRQRDDEGNKDAEQGIRRWECQQVSKSCMKLGKLKTKENKPGPGRSKHRGSRHDQGTKRECAVYSKSVYEITAGQTKKSRSANSEQHRN